MQRTMTDAVELDELEAWYTDSINHAVADNRLDVADELARDFVRETERLGFAA